MDIYLLDKSFQRVKVIENYESFIWTERFDEHGDCTMVGSLQHHKLSDYPRGYYIELVGSQDLMVIRSVEIKYDPEKGRYLEVIGKALTTILEQRVIWLQTNYEDTAGEFVVSELLRRNVIAPSDSFRRISQLTQSTTYPSNLPSMTVSVKLNGETLLEAISDILKEYDVGFRIVHYERGKFRFQLMVGTDRSANQSVRPRVMFSPEYDNLDEISYFTSMNKYANAIRVVGEGDNNARVYRTINRSGVATGLERFEHQIKGDSKSSSDDSMTNAQYNKYLDKLGKNELKETRVETVFDGKTDIAMSEGYEVDYFLGDLVQISDGDQINTPARIVEFIRSDDSSNGVQAYPSLRIPEED